MKRVWHKFSTEFILYSLKIEFTFNKLEQEF